MDSTTVRHAVPHQPGQEVNGHAMRTLYAALLGVPDGRCKRGRRYEVGLVLTLMLLAKMAGESTLSGIAEWVRLRKGQLSEWLPLVRVPCANTYRYVCEHVDVGELNARLIAILSDREPAAAPAESPPGANERASVTPALRHLACDGKELRGSYRLTMSGVQSAQGVFGIYEAVSGRMQVLLPIESKGYEAKAFRQWLKEQEADRGLHGCLLTADALHTQSAVCKAITKAGADYLLVVKRNQRSLREDIDFLFSHEPDFWFPERHAKSVTTGHGRIEVRTLRASDELNAYLADRWPGVQQVFQVERTVTRRSRTGTRTTVECVYGLTSVPASRASPEQLLEWVQAHWRIENRSHWRRDATLGEDRLQLASRAASLVIAVLNCVLLALFDQQRIKNVRSAIRSFAADPGKALALLLSPL